MLRFQLLSKLELSDFPKLERLEGLTELPCLEKLQLGNLTALKSISGGPFPSLSELDIWNAKFGRSLDGNTVELG
jgi:hypothetical protein